MSILAQRLHKIACEIEKSPGYSRWLGKALRWVLSRLGALYDKRWRHVWCKRHLKRQLEMRSLQERFEKNLLQLNMTAEERVRYRVGFRYGKAGYDESVGLWWGASFGIALFHQDVQIAMLGFEPRGRAFLVKQLQGRVGAHNKGPLHAISWERSLLTLLLSFREVGWWTYSEVRMITSTQVDTWRPGTAERLKRRYDGMSAMLGFVLDEKKRQWVKSLQ